MMVSFDFDGVLTQPEVQKYARELVDRGVDVLIHTQRPPELRDDVFNVCDKIGVDYLNIRFCGKVPKEYFLEDLDIRFHLDNDPSIQCDRLIVLDRGFKSKCEKAML